MSPEKAIKILKATVNTAGFHVSSLKLYGEADDAEEFLQAIRVVLRELRTLQSIVEHDRGVVSRRKP